MGLDVGINRKDRKDREVVYLCGRGTYAEDFGNFVLNNFGKCENLTEDNYVRILNRKELKVVFKHFASVYREWKKYGYMLEVPFDLDYDLEDAKDKYDYIKNIYFSLRKELVETIFDRNGVYEFYYSF